MAQCELMPFQTKRHIKTRWDLANKCVDDSFVGIERRMGGGELRRYLPIGGVACEMSEQFEHVLVVKVTAETVIESKVGCFE